MTELVLLLVVGIILVAFFVLALLRGHSSQVVRPEVAEALREIVVLPGLDFKNASAVFDDTDYNKLLRVPELKGAARELRKDRRRLALLWLKLLRRDSLSLWRFRRVLTRYGATDGQLGELQIALEAVTGLVLLFCLRLVIFTTGPFALAGLLRNANSQVTGLSRSCATLLGRIPASRWNEVQQAWTAMSAS